MTDLNIDAAVIALEKGLEKDECLRGYRSAIMEIIRELRMLRAKSEKVDALNKKIERLSAQLETAMRH